MRLRCTTTTMAVMAIGVTSMLALTAGTLGGLWLADVLDDRAAVPPERLVHTPLADGANDDGSSPRRPIIAPTIDGDESVLTASLHAGEFELGGVVPSIEVANEIRATAVTMYGTDIVDRLAVDPGVAEAPWFDVAPAVVAALPIISSGSVTVVTDTVTIEGVAGSTTKRVQFRDSIVELLGTNIGLVDRVTVLEQTAPSLIIRKSGAHTIEVVGVVPSEERRDEIERSIIGAYAGYNIETDLAVDAGVEDTFTLHSLPEFAELFFGFPAWELSYVDENLQSSSSGSAAFDVGSAAVPPLGERILDSVAARLAGMPSLRLAVEGHTDASGDATFNQRLSEDRAQAVVDYLVRVHDVEPSRLEAHGFGETDPIDTNETEEGRERNRRVDFRFVLAPGATTTP